VGRLVIAPGSSIADHRDATEEYIHVLSGTGTVTIDGQTYDVGPGTTVFMPASATVAFQNASEPLVALQVFAGPESAAKYDAWLDPTATPVQRPRR
jgi:quercetin dioxygenase-like cupin family protein